MLTLIVGETEYFDEEKNKFLKRDGTEIQLEHSLVSLSKWESFYEKPFLTKKEKNEEEVLKYVECMIITPDFPPEEISHMSSENLSAINQYVEAKMTATFFYELEKAAATKEQITAELIYYWMISFQIPFECQNWHLNRLLTLIKVCNIKNSKPQKKSSSEIAALNKRLNAERKAKYNTRG